MKSGAVQRVRLIKAATFNAEVKHLLFEVVGRRTFTFEPGQYVRLSKAFEGRRQDRYYSVASPPEGTNRFELCLNPVQSESPFGASLARMQPGEELDLYGPDGGFRLRNPLRTSVFLATGTGIAPFRSMLRYLLSGQCDRSGGAELTLIFGARTPEWLFFREEFEELQRRRPNFRFWPTLSGSQAGWRGRSGYVQHHLDEALRDRRAVDVYLCGRKEMVEEVRTGLHAKGFDEDAIVYEKYE